MKLNRYNNPDRRGIRAEAVKSTAPSPSAVAAALRLWQIAFKGLAEPRLPPAGAPAVRAHKLTGPKGAR